MQGRDGLLASGWLKLRRQLGHEGVGTLEGGQVDVLATLHKVVVEFGRHVSVSVPVSSVQEHDGHYSTPLRLWWGFWGGSRRFLTFFQIWAPILSSPLASFAIMIAKPHSKKKK